MATTREEALAILQQAGSDEVRITYLPDSKIHIEIIPYPTNTTATAQKGRWAQVAAELARENYLGNGLGDKVRTAIREFRDGFEFREGFSVTKDT